MAEARTIRVVALQPKSASEKPVKLGLVCTFYSFKGGVGRSMALANVAVLLARWGQRVLAVDWDLEAPGLERFFGTRLRGSRHGTPGLIDLISSYDVDKSSVGGSPINWRDCLMKASVPQGEAIDILHAGREGETYAKQLRALNWDRLFERDFGGELEKIRHEWKREYDYVLIDSRTGITDTGGICSILLPDYLVSLFTTTEQSVLGVKDVMARARATQQELPLDRQRLVIIPIAARDESNTEYKRAAEWRQRFARELSSFYDDWIHKDETAESVLNYLKIPYVAFWSFGESLPVLEEDATNPKTLAYSYALLARLIHGRLNWAEVREGREATELQAQKAAEVASRLAEANKARIEAIAQQQAEAERVLEQRKNLLLGRFEQLHTQSRRNKRLMDICLALLTAVTAGLLAASFWIDRYIPIATLISIVGGVVVVAAMVAAGLIPLRMRAARIGGALEREYAAYTIGHGRYAEVPGEIGLRIFADRIERITEGRDLDASEPPSPAAVSSVASAPGATSSSASAGAGLGTGIGMPLPPAATEGSDMHSHAGGTPIPPSAPYDDHLPIDVYLSSSSVGISRDWVIEFTPLFVRWLSEILGRDVSIFSAAVQPAIGESWAEVADRAIGRARTAIVILSRRNLQSEFGRRELKMLLERLPPNRIFPLGLESVRPEDMPPELTSIQWTDFSGLAYVGEGFAKSERYIEFQDRIRALANQVAAAIEKGDEQAENAPSAT
jgi:cellulose biosynthesis protein BcsQ